MGVPTGSHSELNRLADVEPPEFSPKSKPEYRLARCCFFDFFDVEVRSSLLLVLPEAFRFCPTGLIVVVFGFGLVDFLDDDADDVDDAFLGLGLVDFSLFGGDAGDLANFKVNEQGEPLLSARATPS